MSWLKDLQKCCEMQRTKGMARMKSLKKGTRKQEEDEDLKSEAPLWVRVLRLPQLRQTQRTHHNKKNRYRTTSAIRVCAAINPLQR